MGSSTGAMDLTAPGDVPNVAARLAAHAAPGEMIVGEAICEAADLDLAELVAHSLSLKGRAEAVEARALRVSPR